jgi:hypothetical protein
MVVKRGLILLLALSGAAAVISAADKKAAFEFQDEEYFHRWSQGEQHEFTPAQQEDLEHWTDMVTINGYPAVTEGEKLAGVAKMVLENYRTHGGKILKTKSLPATDKQPAEHFIAVLFTRPGFAEAAFARFKLVDGKGYSFVYSHRIYGKQAKEEMGEWLKDSGETTEEALLDWDGPGR